MYGFNNLWNKGKKRIAVTLLLSFITFNVLRFPFQGLRESLSSSFPFLQKNPCNESKGCLKVRRSLTLLVWMREQQQSSIRRRGRRHHVQDSSHFFLLDLRWKESSPSFDATSPSLSFSSSSAILPEQKRAESLIKYKSFRPSWKGWEKSLLREDGWKV